MRPNADANGDASHSDNTADSNNRADRDKHSTHSDYCAAIGDLYARPG